MKASCGQYRQRIAAILLLAVLMLDAALATSVDGVQVASAALSARTKTTNGMVRIYLSSLGNPSTLNLNVQGSYSVNGQLLSSGTALTVSFNASRGQLSLSYHGQSYNMGRSFSIRRHSASGTNGILIAQARENKNPYPGDLSFEAVATTAGYKLYTIAHVYIEDYLYGVLPYEMGNASNIEALKAQAVAARTYTVRMMDRRASGIYDVVDTTSDQVYRGTPSGNANCVSAVNATKGIVLMYGSEYITTYYSASNGGQTETARGGTSYAYMTVKDDPFDYANPSSTVKSKTIYADLSHSSNSAQLISLLQTKAAVQLKRMGYAVTAANVTLETLRSITPHTPMYADPSRLYTKMDFSMTVSTPAASGVGVTVTCDIFDELESLLAMGIQSADNELWSVVNNGSSFQLQARRYGHGMGMSQRGAMYMAKLGYAYDEILGFYYDGCERVKHSFIQTILSASSDEISTVEPPADLEEDTGTTCRGMVNIASTSAVLAIRAVRSTGAAMIGAVSNGAIVEVLSSDGSWCMIRFGEICGYVPANALTISGIPPQTQADVSSVLGFATVTANDYVNLRASAGMSGRVLGTAPTGAVLTVFNREGSWAKVQYNALTAYVSTQYISAVTAVYPSAVSSGSSAAVIRTENMTSTVNLRQSPSMNAPVIAQLPAGASVTLLSDDGAWCRISYQGTIGYVVSSFVAVPDDETVPPQKDDHSQQQPENAEQTAVVATEFGALNLRSEAWAGSMILTTIPKGTRVQVLSKGEKWTAVYYNGFSGHVVSSYLAFEQQEDPQHPAVSSAVVVTPSGTLNLRSEARAGSPILAAIPPGASVSVHAYSAEWCHVTYHGTAGYVMTQFLSFEEKAETKPPVQEEGMLHATVTTASGALNLRQEPSPFAMVVGLIPQHQTVQVHQRGSSWCYVTYGGMSGYVMSEFLTFETGSAPEQDAGSAQTAYVHTADGSLNLRELPGSTYRVLTAIPRNAKVTVLENGAEWCFVSYGGYTGYVMTRYLRWQSEMPADDEEDDLWNETNAWVATASGALNLREEPSSVSKVLAVLPRLTQVKLLEKGNEWSYVCYQDHSGYVMTRYLSDSYPIAAASTAESIVATGEMKLDVTLAIPPAPLFAVNATGYPIELYRMCEEAGTPVAVVQPDDEVEIVLVGEIWSCVAYENVQGYCQTRLLSVVE